MEIRLRTSIQPRPPCSGCWDYWSKFIGGKQREIFKDSKLFSALGYRLSKGLKCTSLWRFRIQRPGLDNPRKPEKEAETSKWRVQRLRRILFEKLPGFRVLLQRGCGLITSHNPRSSKERQMTRAKWTQRRRFTDLGGQDRRQLSAARRAK